MQLPSESMRFSSGMNIPGMGIRTFPASPHFAVYCAASMRHADVAATMQQGSCLPQAAS